MDQIQQILLQTLQVTQVATITAVMEVTAIPHTIPPRRTQAMQLAIQTPLATTLRLDGVNT